MATISTEHWHLQIAHLPHSSDAITLRSGASDEAKDGAMQNRQSRDQTDWISVIAIVSVFTIASLALHFGWMLR
ncbi:MULTISPECIES: hypothetical protein [unclassified Bradyrhizobium]|uniref:hypothetical protein n=1 Tax=Bradyrhizobium TaxID=374 RepID=UPI0028E48A27|nr:MULTISPECIES: hypothetical protein [unclassified Bradyrhizobium]